MHSFGVFYTFSIFQAFGVLIMSIGLKRTVKTIIKFPPIILTPIFSIWTIGPVMSKKSVCGSSCYNGHQKLGVSICLTWINLLLSFAFGFFFFCIFVHFSYVTKDNSIFIIKYLLHIAYDIPPPPTWVTWFVYSLLRYYATSAYLLPILFAFILVFDVGTIEYNSQNLWISTYHRNGYLVVR